MKKKDVELKHSEICEKVDSISVQKTGKRSVKAEGHSGQIFSWQLDR